jgi:predicted lipoprotein
MVNRTTVFVMALLLVGFGMAPAASADHIETVEDVRDAVEGVVDPVYDEVHHCYKHLLNPDVGDCTIS